MADNWSSGGATFRGDDVGGILYQIVKLDVGGDGATIGITGDSTLLAVPTTNRDKVSFVTLALTTTAGAYLAGDGIGGLLTFASASRITGGTGYIRSVSILDKDMISPDVELLFFNQTLSASTVTNNDPIDIDDTELTYYLGSVDFTAADYTSFTDNGVATALVDLPFLTSGSTSLFGVLRASSAETFTSTAGLTIVLGIKQN